MRVTHLATRLPLHKHRNEKGMTLIEVVVALMILGMIMTILYAFLFMGISMYKRITVDTQIRNQGDIMFSQVITELKDAVYAQNMKDNGQDTGGIIYVKRAVDENGNYNPKEYVDEYSMTVEDLSQLTGDEEPYKKNNNGIVIRNVRNRTIEKTIDLSSMFTLELKDANQLRVSGFSATSDKMVHVRLAYRRNESRMLLPAEQSKFEINTNIPLFRIE
ncbi:PilW family protein [Paenibacillus dokdonensis]|uniref:PilW family protein n=1 Tax=Paenibacillus dokdonensis TaxID=2567944 RepID=UPI0010A8C21A|nr:prepilin-type N-terminal cleavage/methylation domain-containing protein [Paenibacillus dokdonensis]